MTLSKKICLAFTAILFSHQALSSQPKIWGDAEYLSWWTNNSPISVPLITANNNPAAFGIINEPGTQIIFGSGSSRDNFNFGNLRGVKLSAGDWISENYGIEGNIFSFPEVKNSFSASSLNSNIPIINIPFFSTQATAFSQAQTENVLVNRLPNTASVSDSFRPWGAEFNGLYQTCYPCILIAGLRYLNINEDFNLNDAIYNNPSLPPNTVFNVNDDFKTKNNFIGLQIGARADTIYNNFIFDCSFKVAVGKVYQQLTINGQSNLNNSIVIQNIGLFAEPTNIGNFNHQNFAILPEFSAKLAYQCNKYFHPFISYNFLFINNVIRPAKQIDRNINLSQNRLFGGTGILTGAPAPAVKFHPSNLWMQGLSLGIEFNFY